MMLKRQLGSLDLWVSPLGLGTVKLGRNQQVKYPQAFNIPDDKQAAELLACAQSLGINLLDTAPAYGNSEQRLGQLLRGQRQNWIICTKTGEEFINGQSAFDFTPEHTIFSVKRSLKRLQTDYLDIVLIHSDGNDTAILQHYGTLDALLELKQQGLIRAIGMSTKTIAGGLLTLEKTDLAMITYHQAYTAEQPVIDYAATQHKGLFIKKAWDSGQLFKTNLSAQEHINFIFSQPSVTSIIVGTISPQHLQQNAQLVAQALRHL